MASSDPDQFLRPDEFWYEVGLKANQTVVHLGCGAGFFLNPAAKIVGSNGKVFGIDIQEDLLEEASWRAERDGLDDVVVTKRCDLEVGPVKSIKANTIDWTLVVNILSQADITKVLREAKRITKPGGRIVAVEWSSAQAVIGPPVEDRVVKDELLAVAEKLKLEIAGEFAPSPYHYGLFMAV